MVENKEVAVTLHIEEVKYAIKNKTHVTARSLEASGKLGYESASHLQADSSMEDSYEVERAIVNALNEVKVSLCEYLDETVTSTDNLVSDAVSEGGTITLSFHLPGNYNSASVSALGSGIHDYVVCRSIHSWYRETMPELADACQSDAMSSLSVAKSALYKRVRPQRPTSE